ncbi:MAG: SLC13 family permease [Coriobacteriales bacterium]
MREKLPFKVGITAISILIVIITFLIPTPEGLAFEGKMLLGILVACVVMWICEPIPIVVTAWAFAAAVPLMGILSSNETWMSGISVAMIVCLPCFAFALFVQYSSISLRIIAFILKWAKNDSKKVLAGLMLATALLSLIIDDLVLVLVMLPFAYRILDENKTPWGNKSNLAKALVLGIAFASYIGGWITPVGSVVNILAMGFAEQAFGITVTFANWMVLGIIMNIILLPLSWFVIVKIFKPEPISDEAIERIQKERAEISGFGKDEIWGMLVIVVTLGLWIAGSWVPQLDMTVIGLFALFLMFLPPFKCVSFKKWCDESPWSVVMLNWAVGCFVAGFIATGAMVWLVNTAFAPLLGLPVVVVMILVAAFACVIHNILPAGAAVAGLITIPVCGLVISLGGNVTAAIFMCAVFSSAAFLLPLDLCVYVAYASERKYFSPFDELKVGWIPSIAAILMVSIVLPLVCTAMGLA